MNRRHARLACLVGLALTPLGVATTATAHAALVGTSDAGPLRIMPGSSEVLDLSVPNDSDAPADLRVQAVGVTEDDNGCVLPEQQAGDTTCGPDGGELGGWLALRLVRTSDAGEQELWSGTLDQLATGTDVLEGVAGGSTPPLRLEVALPRAATNETQSDRVGFTLRWTYTGQPSQATVLGVQQGTSGASGVLGGLADTGTAVSLGLVAALAALLAAGGGMVACGRRGRSAARTVDGT
ncbi:MAG TPA: hypothetical protein VF416_05645 [Marmoricola sp.]